MFYRHPPLLQAMRIEEKKERERGGRGREGERGKEGEGGRKRGEEERGGEGE